MINLWLVQKEKVSRTVQNESKRSGKERNDKENMHGLRLVFLCSNCFITYHTKTPKSKPQHSHKYNKNRNTHEP